MDPLTAFSVAAAALGVVDFGLKTVSTFRKLSRDGTAQNDPLESLSKDFNASASKLRNSIRSVSSATVLTEEDQALYDLSCSCEKTASLISQELEKLHVTGTGRLERNIEAAKKTIASIWKAGKLKKLEVDLLNVRKALDTRILLQLRERSIASALCSSAEFEKLDTDVRALVSAIAQNQTTCKQVIEHQHVITRQEIATQHQSTRDYISQEHVTTRSENTAGIERLKDNLKSEEHIKAFLKSLSFEGMTSRRDNAPEAYSDTYTWIWESSTASNASWNNFCEWVEKGEEIYWISGKPGSGKTTLAKLLWSEEEPHELFKKWANELPLLKISFFAHFVSHDELRKNVPGLLRSILHQILESSPDLLQSAMHDQKIPVWTIKKLQKTLLSVVGRSSGSIRFLLLLDGLDELRGDVDDFLSYLSNLNSFDNIKICVTSRPESKFRIAFHNSPGLRLHELNAPDIRTFVVEKINAQITRLPSRRLHLDDLDIGELADTICEKAEGVFMWVVLAVGYVSTGINDGNSRSWLLDALAIMPPELDDMYQHMLQRIPQPYKKDVAKYLRFILAADRALTPLDFVLLADDKDYYHFDWGLIDACTKTKDALLSRCIGLLEINIGSQDGESYSYEPETWEDCEDWERWNDEDHVGHWHQAARFKEGSENAQDAENEDWESEDESATSNESSSSSPPNNVEDDSSESIIDTFSRETMPLLSNQSIASLEIQNSSPQQSDKESDKLQCRKFENFNKALCHLNRFCVEFLHRTADQFFRARPQVLYQLDQGIGKVQVLSKLAKCEIDKLRLLPLRPWLHKEDSDFISIINGARDALNYLLREEEISGQLSSALVRELDTVMERITRIVHPKVYSLSNAHWTLALWLRMRYPNNLARSIEETCCAWALTRTRQQITEIPKADPNHLLECILSPRVNVPVSKRLSVIAAFLQNDIDLNKPLRRGFDVSSLRSSWPREFSGLSAWQTILVIPWMCILSTEYEVEWHKIIIEALGCGAEPNTQIILPRTFCRASMTSHGSTVYYDLMVNLSPLSLIKDAIKNEAQSEQILLMMEQRGCLYAEQWWFEVDVWSHSKEQKPLFKPVYLSRPEIARVSGRGARQETYPWSGREREGGATITLSITKRSALELMIELVKSGRFEYKDGRTVSVEEFESKTGSPLSKVEIYPW